MANEKALKILRDTPIDVHADNLTDYADAQGAALDALMAAEKYRWHDLRKDPEDLPENDGLLFLYVYGTSHPEYGGTSKHLYGSGTYTGNGFQFIADLERIEVIAWRYIEPFEEVEE